jgi:hypothetical protein
MDYAAERRAHSRGEIMPVFEIQTPDGRRFEIEARDMQEAASALPPEKSFFQKYVDDPVRAMAQGATFGWADPIAARMGALTGQGSYEENLARERAQTAAIPGAIRYPAEIAGAIGSTVAAAPATAAGAALTGVERLPWLARTVLGGGAGGALFGAGEAPPGERLTGAGEGAVVGGVLGPVAAGAGNIAGRIGAGVRNALLPQTGAATDLARALTRDELTAAELAQRAAETQQIRSGATLADVGGENVRGVLERVAQTPGAGRTIVTPFLSARQTGQRSRLASDLETLTGAKQTAVEAIDQTMADRASAAKPIYDIAFDFNARLVPEVAAAWDRETATGYGRSILLNPNFRRTLQTEYGIRDPANAPLMKQIDAWKKVADDQVADAIRSGQGNKARVLSGMRDRMLDVLDEANPAYARARAAWAGPSKYLDAIDAGKDILSRGRSAQEVTRDFARLGESEQEGYRIGAVSAIVARMGEDPAKFADMTKYLRAPAMREKVAALMPTAEARDKWQRILSFEISSSELTGRALGGSATARRLAERDEAASLVGDLVLDAVTGASGVGLLKRLATGAPRWLRDKLRQRTDAAVARMLTDPSMAGLLNVAQRAGQLQAPSGALPAFAGGALAPPTAEQFRGAR